MNKDNLSIKNLQKVDDTKIEDSHPYIAELVKIIKKLDFRKCFKTISIGGLDSYYVKKLSNKKIKIASRFPLKDIWHLLF